jgi:hypothetical protein
MEQLLTPSGQCWVFPTPPNQLDARTPSSFVPQAIAQALARALRFQDFARGPIHRLALCVIVGFASKDNPGEPIYIRKTVLGGYIGRSLPQLRRYLADLEADGWIERHQHISRAAGAQVGSITLTAKCIAAFFAKEQPAATVKKTSHPTPSSSSSGPAKKGGGDEKPSSTQRRSSMSDALLDIPSPTITKNLRGNPRARAREEGGWHRGVETETQAPNPGQPQPKATQSTAGTGTGTNPAREPEKRTGKELVDRVPAELRWLCGKGISPFGVFGLMAKAKTSGTTLQQVLRCLSLSSGLASVKNLYAYINQILAKPRDWDRVERQMQARQAREPEKLLARRRDEEEVQQRKEFAHLDGMVFHQPKTGIWYKVWGAWAMVFRSEGDLRRGLSASGCSVQRVLDLIKAGDVMPAPALRAQA